MGFPRQEYWRGLPFPSPGDLPNTGIEPGSPALQADALPFELPGKLRYTYIPSLSRRRKNSVRESDKQEVDVFKEKQTPQTEYGPSQKATDPERFVSF